MASEKSQLKFQSLEGIGLPRGAELLHDPILNKGIAFTEAERDALGLRGLLPPRVLSEELQITRILESVHNKNTPLEKYIYMVVIYPHRLDHCE